MGQTNQFTGYPVSRVPSGADVQQEIGPYGDQLVAQAHGKHFNPTISALHYCATIATAAAVPIITSTTQALALWNPSTSKVLVPTRLCLGWVVTTEVPGNIQLAVIKATGSSVATGAPILTATVIVAQSCLLGSGAVPTGQAFSACTLTAAPTLFATTGLSHLTTTGASTTLSPFYKAYEFDGTVVIAPQTALFIVGNAATASTYQQSIYWYELNA